MEANSRLIYFCSSDCLECVPFLHLLGDSFIKFDDGNETEIDRYRVDSSFPNRILRVVTMKGGACLTADKRSIK